MHWLVVRPAGRIDARYRLLIKASARRARERIRLDDCLYALQPTIPHLKRSSLHSCLQRHGVSRLPDVEGDEAPKRQFKRYPFGCFHTDIAQAQTAEGKLQLFS